MSTELSLSPGETFRKLMTFYEQGRDGPRLDLTGVVWEVANLSEDAPWTAEIQPASLVTGQVYLHIPAAETINAPANGKFPIQIRMTFPGSGDKKFLDPIVIHTGPAYVPII